MVIIETLKSIPVFSSDPDEKKIQLLLQKISSYNEFKSLEKYCNPAIDYHIIRLFLRRGLITPKTEYARRYIFKVCSGKNENTIGSLRQLCSNTVRNISSLTSLSINTINQIEWWIGRSICIENNPDCNLESNESDWLKPFFQKCPYYEDCYANKFNTNFLKLNEPKYNGVSY
jgi:hypothetical protein